MRPHPRRIAVNIAKLPDARKVLLTRAGFNETAGVMGPGSAQETSAMPSPSQALAGVSHLRSASYLLGRLTPA